MVTTDPESRRLRSARHGAASIVALGGCASLAAAILYRNRSFYHDDAYIPLRYVRNLLEGNGLVWNPGEYVQGYTDFLHVVLVAILGWCGVDLYWASRLIGLAAFVALIAVVLRCSRKSWAGGQRQASWTIPTVLVATSAPLLVWSIGGLEGTLFSLLCTAGCCLFLQTIDGRGAERALVGCGLALGLAGLTRPDGLLFVAVTAVWLLAARPAGGGRLRRPAVFAATVATIVVPYTLWQVAYYGDLVPNTFHVKAGTLSLEGSVDGIRYLADYARRPPFLPLLIAVAVAYAIGRGGWNRKIAYLAANVAAYAAFVILVGGDHMQSFRLVLPLVPLMSLMLVPGCAPLPGAGRPRGAIAWTVLILLVSAAQWTSAELNPRREDEAAFVGTVAGKFIAENWPEGSVVALHTAGSTPYHASRHIFIDMLGLNDRHIARRPVVKTDLPWQQVPGHAKGDGAYVLSRRPDYIILGPALGTEAEWPWFLSDLEIARDPRFEREYRRERVVLDREGRSVAGLGFLFTYYRRVRD